MRSSGRGAWVLETAGQHWAENRVEGVRTISNGLTITGFADRQTDRIMAFDVFETSDKGLWDGRPSLGGVWVAYPDVPSPERVIIRNTASGKEVVGALFRRGVRLSLKFVDHLSFSFL